MNWAKENKFLTGYIAVMAIGVGALGFKVFSASGALEEANSRYTAKATAYNRLRRLEPFPSQKNLAEFEAQKKEAAEVISAFQAELAKKEFPVEPMTATEFQDVLKKAVTEVRAKAGAANVTLPKEKFYLGFDRYETAPPDKDAAPILGRQLKAIEWFVQQLVATRITELKDLKRPELPEEKGGKGAAAVPNRPPERGARPGNDRGGDRGGRGGRQDLVSSHSFDIVFTCKPHQLSTILNTVVSPGAPQFLIPRAVRVMNQNPKGPARVDPAAAAAAAAAAAPPPVVEPVPGAPGAPPAAPAPAPAAPVAPVVGDLHYIVGEELIEVSLKLEIVDFAEPATPSPAAPAK